MSAMSQSCYSKPGCLVDGFTLFPERVSQALRETALRTIRDWRDDRRPRRAHADGRGPSALGNFGILSIWPCRRWN